MSASPDATVVSSKEKVEASSAPSTPAGGFVAHASTDVEQFLSLWQSSRFAPPSAFQTAGWLRSWYATLGQIPGNTPVCVTVRHGEQPVILLPLVASRQGGISVVSFADEGVTDYNAALCGPVASDDIPALWTALRTALAGHDLLSIDKMMASPGDQPNPLAAAIPVQPCEMFGNYMLVDEDFDQWHRSLTKGVRKEFERTWRVFTRDPDCRFERITDPAKAEEFFEELEAQQRQRMAHAGDRYVLDKAPWRAMYQTRMREGLADGSVVLTALTCRGELVAGLYGICDGARYVALRITYAGEAWKHCVPGKLLLERTVHHLHGQGVRYIDFAIGDYFHKRVFGVSHTPLVDACVALSVKGVPKMLAWRFRRLLKRQQKLVALVRSLRGRR